MTARRQPTNINRKARTKNSTPAMSPALEEPLLTANDVASFLNVSKITIYEWAQKGKIPAFRLGHHWRFRRSEIETWLDGNRQDSGGGARA